MSSNRQSLLCAIAFALCIAPTLVSYRPYSFKWDDASYLEQSINVSRHFWAGDRHGVAQDFRGDLRPPVMKFMAVPWGPVRTWENGEKSWLTLGFCLSALVAGCLFLLLRLGINQWLLVAAASCVFASLGPYPFPDAIAHDHATGFMADSLFAWTIFTAALLIPYEEISDSISTSQSIWRGVLWAAIISIGSLTKASFLYFIVAVFPYLLVMRWRRSGSRAATITFLSLALCLIPAAGYWIRFGWPALHNGWAASFGSDAPLYFVPLGQFVLTTLKESPGLLLSGIFSLVCLFVVCKRTGVPPITRVLPLLIVLGYFGISIASQNRQIRYMFSGIVCIPLLCALLTSDASQRLSRKVSSWAAILAFACLALAAVPTIFRSDRQSLRRSEVVLAQAGRLSATNVLLASDSPTLNVVLLRLAIALSNSPIKADTLAFSAIYHVPLETDFREIGDADLVVIQDRKGLDSAPTNSRYVQYAQYLSETSNRPKLTVQDGDLNIYCMKGCSPSMRSSATDKDPLVPVHMPTRSAGVSTESQRSGSRDARSVVYFPGQK